MGVLVVLIWGFSAAFVAPGVLLSCAVAVFWSARRRYVVRRPAGSVLVRALRAVARPLLARSRLKRASAS